MVNPKWYEDDTFIAVVGVVLVVAVVWGYGFGAYKFGRYLERKQLTLALVKAIEDAYYNGKDDGITAGYIKGKKAGLVTCDDLLNRSSEDGRY